MFGARRYVAKVSPAVSGDLNISEAWNLAEDKKSRSRVPGVQRGFI
jgi:hypothetical protein